MSKTKKPEQRSETEWTKHDTADAGASYEQAEWVEPQAGTVLEGTLMRAFVMKDDLAGAGGKGKPFRAAYVYADAKGHEWTFGEKAGFARAIRAENMGVSFRLTYVRKEKQLDKTTGKPTGKTIWVTTFETKGVGVGESVLDALKASHRDLVERGDDLPF